MGTYIDSKIITLTSQSATQKRNGTYLSNVLYEMGLFLKDEPDIIHRQVCLQSAQIPYSFYVINYTNSQFKYQLGSGTIFTSSIPVGNYTGNSLITALNTVLTGNGISLAITLSPINGCLTFTHLSSNFTFYDTTYSILQTLGFSESTNYTSTSFILTTPYALNLLGIKILQIRSTQMNMLNYSSIQGGITTLLATIPVSAVPFGMIEYTDKGQNRVTFTNPIIDSIDIEILDGETGNFINFNNQDWTITLCIYLTRLINPPNPAPNVFSGNSIFGLTIKDNQQTAEGGPSDRRPLEEPSKEDKQIAEPAPKPQNKDLQELTFLAE
jgi:hypothetical protein